MNQTLKNDLMKFFFIILILPCYYIDQYSSSRKDNSLKYLTIFLKSKIKPSSLCNCINDISCSKLIELDYESVCNFSNFDHNNTCLNVKLMNFYHGDFGYAPQSMAAYRCTGVCGVRSWLNDYLQTFPVLLKPRSVLASIVPGKCLENKHTQLINVLFFESLRSIDMIEIVYNRIKKLTKCAFKTDKLIP